MKIKTSILLAVSTVIFLNTAGLSRNAFGNPNTPWTFARKFVDIEVIQPKPLFRNAPFLKLRQGDLFVRALLEFRGKQEGHAFPGQHAYFVLTNHKYFEVECKENAPGKLTLVSAQDSRLFDWRPNVEFAATLRQISSYDFNEYLSDLDVTVEEWPLFRQLALEKFPESVHAPSEIVVRSPHLENTGQTQVAVFERLAFSPRSNVVYMARWQIGPGIYRLERNDLITGPPRVTRENLKALWDSYDWSLHAHERGFLSPSQSTIDKNAEDYVKARDDHFRGIEFRGLVNQFLVQPMPSLL